MNEKEITALLTSKIKDVFDKTLTKPTQKLKESVTVVKQIIKEAVALVPKTFVLKTEFLSNSTKEHHFKTYKNYVDSYNKISAQLDSADRNTANNPNDSQYRRLKLDETHNLNGVKLHELYFYNISDLHSTIRLDSLPYLRLARDWGSFDNWQFDFRACGLVATEGWAVCYYDPYKQRYFNTFVEKHTENLPLMGIPVLVVDTWHHAWFRDYIGDKLNYLNAMMKEINWSIVEARMGVAEACNLQEIYLVTPISQTQPQRTVLTNEPQGIPPIKQDQIADKIEVG